MALKHLSKHQVVQDLPSHNTVLMIVMLECGVTALIVQVRTCGHTYVNDNYSPCHRDIKKTNLVFPVAGMSFAIRLFLALVKIYSLLSKQ